MKLLPSTLLKRIERRFAKLYGKKNAPQLMERFSMMVGRYGVGDDPQKPKELWSEKDAILITYADNVLKEEERPLKSLKDFCDKNLKESISHVHILPFYPWSSDDGFSVIDYREVESSYGKWKDVEALGEEFDLMFDLVLNHCSSQSQWFQDFVTGVAPAKDYFIPMNEKVDLSEVVRPRPWPLLSPVMTKNGETKVWTTFSKDQVDLNWQNPDLLFEFIDILFLYIAKGVKILRMDAIAFLWKEIGTNCIHLPETHQIVKLFRDIIDLLAPSVILLTETNVPHEENISYFGKGDEAHMVYNFSLSPLILHALLKGNGAYLTDWAKSLEQTKENCSYLNFTASHDGIGVRPLQGILNKKELNWLVRETESKDGKVNMRKMPDGSELPYELNITYYSILSDPENRNISNARFLLSQIIMLGFKGVPAVYIHSLTGSENDLIGLEESQHNRRINRKKWKQEELDEVLESSESHSAGIFEEYNKLLKTRKKETCFHPDAVMDVYDIGKQWFSFTRTNIDKTEQILCIHNLSNKTATKSLSRLHPALKYSENNIYDLISTEQIQTGSKKSLSLKPYQAMWLKIPLSR